MVDSMSVAFEELEISSYMPLPFGRMKVSGDKSSGVGVSSKAVEVVLMSLDSDSERGKMSQISRPREQGIATLRGPVFTSRGWKILEGRL